MRTHARASIRILSWTGFTCALVACRDATDPGLSLQATGGNDQIAHTGTFLPSPLVVLVVDDRAQPMAGVPVSWGVIGDDQIESLTPVTDASGQAAARWRLGNSPGTRTATATALDAPKAVFRAQATLGPVFPAPNLPLDDLRPLTFATYDGSGQVVHPDHALADPELFAATNQLAITPYPFGNAAFENPSLFVSSGSDLWRLLEGAPNPIVRPESGYLSDPDIVYVPERSELWTYYRQVTTDNIIWLVRSTDGRQWSAPLQVLRAPNHSIVSPAVVRRGPGDWWMFSINSGAEGCGARETRVQVRRSSDGVRWAPAIPADLGQPGAWVWHADVQWIASRGEFWAVYNAKTDGGCATPVVLIATSPDGLSWTTAPQPVLVKGRAPMFRDVAYRTTFAFDAQRDAITFWYSGAAYTGGKYVWGAAVERRLRTSVFAAPFDQDRSTESIVAELGPPPAPLLDWP
jgi:hypothetical protein